MAEKTIILNMILIIEEAGDLQLYPTSKFATVQNPE